MDAVSNGTVECNHVLAGSAYIGKNTALAFDAGLAFGLSARQHNAWVRSGGGLAALREMYKKYGIVNFTCGNVGVQMGGWYPQGNQERGRPEGPEDAHRRTGRHGAGKAGHGAAASYRPPTSIRRWKRARSMRPNG